MNNNPYGYLDENILADSGFHVPTHRIIKVPYKNGRSGGSRFGLLGLGLSLSLSLHLLLLLSLKDVRVTEHADSKDAENQEAMHVELQYPKSLEQLAGGSVRLAEIAYPNPKAELGPETQYTDPKNDNRTRLLDIILPNSSVDAKLRDMILTGKSPGDAYADVKILSKDDYNDFLLLYLKTYFELKRNPRLVTSKNIEDNKVDILFYFITQIEEDGKVNLFSYRQPANLTRLESDITNDALGLLKQIPKFIPPYKANLKAPHQLDFWYGVTYKTLRRVKLPAGARSVAPIR